MEIFAEFLEAYNDELRRIGCSARVGDPGGTAPDGWMHILDHAGHSIGVLPDSIEATELAAVLTLVRHAFARGLAEGQRLTMPAR
jgi:hypothetical protein